MAVLVVPVSEVARRLGLRQPLSEDDRWAVEQAIADAQADVEAYLGRALVPETFTETGLWLWPDGWHLQNGPVLEIVSETPETYPEGGGITGRWTVTYRAGIDVATDPALAPIRRYVTVHAMNAPELRSLRYEHDPAAGRRALSVSAESQSITYQYDGGAEAAAAGGGAPGALPTLQSLDRWRLAGRRVVQAPKRPGAAEPWPYDPPLWWERWW